MVDNTIALQVRPLDIATPLMQAAKMRQMESEQQRTQEADNRDAVASEMRGLAPYANSPDFAGRWTQSIDNLAQAGKMRPDIAARMRDQPSVMAMHSVLAQSESPEMQFRRQEADRAQSNTDRTFKAAQEQAGAPTVTTETHNFMGDKTSSTSQRLLPGQQPYSPPSAAGGASISSSGIPNSPVTGQPMMGDELLTHLKKTDPVSAAALIDMRDGKLNPSVRNNQKLAMVAPLVFPGFDATQYPVRLAVRKSYTSGKDFQETQALNTVGGHMGKLMEAVDRLNPSDWKGVNVMRNLWSDAISDNPALVKLRGALVTTQNELAKAYHGGHVSDASYAAFNQSFNDAMSGHGMKAAIGEMAGLLESKIHAKETGYTTSMDDAPLPANYRAINDEAKTSFSRINDWANGIKRPPGTTPRAAATTENDPPEISAAREAIAKGADRAKVEQRLKQNGIKFSPGDLEL